MTQENTMQFPFETTTKDGRKATVLGMTPSGRLVGFITDPDGAHRLWDWNAEGSPSSGDTSITLPLQIKPLTTYRMRSGEIAWISGLIEDGRIYGMGADGNRWSWRVDDGRCAASGEDHRDLVEELPPGTTE